MNAPAPSMTDVFAGSSIRELLSASVAGLRPMFDDDRQLFCDRLVRAEHGMVRQGISERYTAMTLLGLNRYERAGFRTPFGVRDLTLRLMKDSGWIENPGDAGLMVWTCAEIVPDHLDECLSLTHASTALEGSADARVRSTMELAWFLTGIAKLVLADRSYRTIWEGAARRAFDLLSANQGPFGFFGHRAAGLGPKTWRGRIGSFADQVYPIYAFTMFARAFGSPEALDAARRCADAICGAQGPLGQWWWHYDAKTGRVVQRYPVYAVHQEAMGPMALFAVGETAGRDYDPFIAKGLRWIYGANELGVDMRDSETSVVWRSLRFPSKARLLQQELRGWSRSGSEDVPVSGLTVLHECRPYELGWLLYAFSQKS